jgi:hypothetical protein
LDFAPPFSRLPHGGWGMYSSLIVVGLALTTQVGGADNRYQGGAAGQPGASANPGAATSAMAPLTNSNSPAANGATRSATSTPSSSPYAPSRPSVFSGQPTTPTMNPNRVPANTGQPQPPPGYTGQNSFLNDSASAAQPASKSALMMQTMLAQPRNSQLPGDSVRLVDVVSSGRTRNEQTQRIEAYWDLCSSVADYYLSLREIDELRGLLSSAPAGQSAALQEFDKELGVRSDTALQAARASQFRLAGFIGRGPNNLPLPADMPHCGTYTSRYEQVFAGRNSPEAQVLAQLLPMRYAELDDAAIGVTRDEEWLKGVIAHNQNSDAAGNLRALELLALKRRAFVQIARDYNRRIARYSELATPGQITPDRLIGMLIRRPNSTATRSAAPAPPTGQSSSVETSPQRTFANREDWLPAEKPSTTAAAKVDSAVKPALATESGTGQEHSVVVKPR